MEEGIEKKPKKLKKSTKKSEGNPKISPKRSGGLLCVGKKGQLGRSYPLRDPASTLKPGETESTVVYEGAGATSVVGWLRVLLARPKEAGAKRVVRRRNTSVVSVSFLRDLRKQEKEAERSAAAKGIAGEPNNRDDGPPT